MAVYLANLAITLITQTERAAEYEFATTEGRCGSLRLTLEAGTIELVNAMPGSEGEAHFARAAHKVRSHWRKGELPTRTCWAS